MAFSQLQKRLPVAPGRTPSQQALSSSYQVKGQAWHEGWGCSFSGTASPDASWENLPMWTEFWPEFFGLQDFPDPIFWQNLITREAALGLGSGDGVQGSLSSTLVSKVRNQLVV